MSSIPPSRPKFSGHLARTMVVILLLLSLAPFLLVIVVGLRAERNALSSQVSSQIASIVKGQGERIRSDLQTGQVLLNSVIPNLAQYKWIDFILSYRQAHPNANPTAPGPEHDIVFTTNRDFILNDLRAINQPRAYFDDFLIIDSNGRVLLASNPSWENRTISANGLSSVWNKMEARILAGNTFEDLYGTGNKHLAILTAIPYIHSEQNVPTCMIVGVADSNALQAILYNASYYADQQYFYTADGQLTGLSPDATGKLQLTRYAPESLAAAYRQALLGQANSFEASSPQGQAVIAAKVWLNDLNIGWIGEAEQTRVYAQIEQLLSYGLLTAILLSAILVWISIRLSRQLVRPILAIATAAEGFAQGRWEQRAPVSSNDEIGLLAYTFNQMAEDLSNMYRSLEATVEARTQQVRTSAEVSEIASTASSMENLLQRTTQLVVERFHLAVAGIYLLDEAGRFAALHSLASRSSGKDADQISSFKSSVEIDPNPEAAGPTSSEAPLSSAAWAIGLNQPHLFHSATPGQEQTGVNAEITKAWIEAAIPISVSRSETDQKANRGSLSDRTFSRKSSEVLALGALQVRSSDAATLNEETLAQLQALVNQISPAIQNFRLLESTQVNLQETNLLYRASHQIAQAETFEGIFQVALRALGQTPYLAAYLIARQDAMEVISTGLIDKRNSGLRRSEKSNEILRALLPVQPSMIESLFASGPMVIQDVNQSMRLPTALLNLPRQMGCESAAFLPVTRAGRLSALLMLGLQTTSTPASDSRKSKSERAGSLGFSALTLQPFSSLADLITTTLEKVEALTTMQKRMVELQTINTLSQSISAETEMNNLYRLLHKQIENLMGDVSFYVALYDSESNMISIPYMIEGDQHTSVQSFPFGEGLTSILIRTRQPLLLNENLAEKLEAMGAKLSGVPAKSWLGTPLMVQGEAIGAMVVQDTQHEQRFSDEDLRLLTTLAGQVAIFIRNVRLLDSTRQQVEREHLLNEITAKIRRSTSMEAILQTTTQELVTALGARRGQIQVGLTSLSSMNEPGQEG